MNDQRKDYSDPSRPQKGTTPYNYRPIRTDDMENTNVTN